MAGKWKTLIDNSLAKGFDAPVYDPAKGRQQFVKALTATKEQFVEGKTKVPNRAWKAGNNQAVRFSPKLGGQPVVLDGLSEHHVSAERFPEFIDLLIADVNAGELDAEIKAALEGKGSGKSSGSSSKPRKASTGGGTDGLGDIRKSLGASINRYKKGKAEAKASALAKSDKEGKGWAEADIDKVLAEFQ